MIRLGEKVQDKISGLEGIAVSRTEYLNGCVQYGVMPKIKKGTTEIPSWNIDESQLVSLERPTKPKKPKSPPGGPSYKIT